MKRGAIAVDDLAGGFDLRSTLESGQSYLWNRTGIGMYDPNSTRTDWYHTAVDGHFLRVRQRDGSLEWESTVDAVPILVERFRLDDDLDAIRAETATDPIVSKAYDTYPGMRLVRDPPFPCLISFICSAQMRVERIYDMQAALSREYGESLTINGRTYFAFPSAERLAQATEQELRGLGLGYRAPYVVATATQVATGETNPETVRGYPYEKARDYLTQFVGVGNKVADCVLLFSLDFLEAVPLDTWIRSAIETHFPDCDHGTYAETSRAIRSRLGGSFAGYAQTYLFHYLRLHA